MVMRKLCTIEADSCKVQILTHIKYHESFNASAKVEVQDIRKASVYVGKIPPHTQFEESIKK
jgi:hypothetical protein